MKTSALLRTFSSKLSARLSPSSIAPWPPVRTAFDRWLTSELDDLRVHPNLFATAAWLAKSLDTAISAQQTAVESVQSAEFGTDDAKVFDACLDDTVELLDACNIVRQRIEDIRTYVASVATALHCLEAGHGGRAAVRRAQAALDSCAAMERRCAELDTCGSSLRKLGERLAQQDRRQEPESELYEILTGSRAIALLAISMANIALSFRSRRGVPVVQSSRTSSSWGSTLFEMQKVAKEEFEKRKKDHGVAVLEELKATVSAAQRLRSLICRRDGEGGGEEERRAVGELRRRCEELEEGVRPLEEGVDGLYRGLIDVRMCLLGVISQGINCSNC